MAEYRLALVALALSAVSRSAGGETSLAAGCAERAAACEAEPDELVALQARGSLAEVRASRRAGAAASVLEASPSTSAEEKEFEQFLRRHKRRYHGNKTEYHRRLSIFKKTLRRIMERNAHESTHNKHPHRAVHGVTKYADWSEEEFHAILGFRRPGGVHSAGEHLHAAGKQASFIAGEAAAAPCTHNWASRGEIRDQGLCGNCWAFTTAELLRSSYLQQHGVDPGKLSTQYLTDCMVSGICPGGVQGCCGGSPAAAMEWVSQQGGIPTQEAYGDYYDLPFLVQGGPLSSPHGITYSGNNPTTRFPCKADVPKAVTTSGIPVRHGSEADMASHVCSVGSVSVIVDASTFMTYLGGVMSPASCGTGLNHAMVVVGMNASANAWILQNSWGEDWGASLDGSPAIKDMYSNCADLAGPFREGCDLQVIGGGTVASFCRRSCAGPDIQLPTGGYAYIQYGGNTCGIAAEAYSSPATSPA